MPKGICFSNQELRFLRDSLGKVPLSVTVARPIYDKVVEEFESRKKAAQEKAKAEPEEKSE